MFTAELRKPFSVYSIVAGRVPVAFETYPSKQAVGGIIKKCGIIKRFNPATKNLHLFLF